MTTPAFDFPTPAELSRIEQITLPKMIEDMDSPFMDAFPFEPHEDTVIMWEQLDNFTGLMNFRGYGNKPTRVSQIGAQRFMTQPGVYGDFMVVDEELLTRRRLLGSFGQRMTANDLIAINQKKLLDRRLNLQHYIISQFVITGTYSVPDGGTGFSFTGDSFTPQSYSPATYAWSDHVNSVPLFDMMQMALIPFGQSVKVGPESEFVINRIKWNDLLLNRNSADFWGFRDPYGATVSNSLDSINEMLASKGLPRIRVYDGFYLADNGTRKGSPTRILPTANGVLFAKRTSGAKAGAFAITYNAQSQGATPYTRVIYKGQQEIPDAIEVHDGFNGGPLIRYPGAIVVASGL